MSLFSLLIPIVFLILSNVMMTFAWYGHLKFPQMALWLAILVSWGLAFFEYCLAVPANRIGYQVFSIAELKTLQVVIAMSVFVFIAVVFFDEKFTPQHILGFVLMGTGAALIFGAKQGV